MNMQTRTLIRSTWQQVVPVADAAADLFYRRLFEIDPGLRPLFAGADMDAQKASLLQALSAVVDGLEDIDRLQPRLAALGRRHVGYGATPKHYESVGAALLWTLEQGLGAAWSESVEAAWRDAYGLVSGVMQAAATGDESSAGTPAVRGGEDDFMPRTDFRPGLIN